MHYDDKTKMNRTALDRFGMDACALIQRSIEEFRDFIIEPENLQIINDPDSFNVKETIRWELLFKYNRGDDNQELVRSLYRFLYDNEVYDDLYIAYKLI